MKIITSGIFLFFVSFTSYSQEIKDTIKLKSIEIIENTLKKQSFVINNISKIQIQSANIRDVGDFLRTVPNVSGVRKGGTAVDPVIRGFKYSP